MGDGERCRVVSPCLSSRECRWSCAVISPNPERRDRSPPHTQVGEMTPIAANGETSGIPPLNHPIPSHPFSPTQNHPQRTAKTLRKPKPLHIPHQTRHLRPLGRLGHQRKVAEERVRRRPAGGRRGSGWWGCRCGGAKVGGGEEGGRGLPGGGLRRGRRGRRAVGVHFRLILGGLSTAGRCFLRGERERER